LLLSAFREKVSEFVEAARSLLTSPLPFPERLFRFIEFQFESIEAEPALAMVLLLESRQSTKFYGGAVRDVLRTYAGAIDELLQSGVGSGAVRPDADLPIMRRVLIGALEEVELDWLLGDRSWRLSSLAPRLTETIYRGLKP
jgi:TetR/AcrR family fatty acid metabolism transcriptional regulator